MAHAGILHRFECRPQLSLPLQIFDHHGVLAIVEVEGAIGEAHASEKYVTLVLSLAGGIRKLIGGSQQ